MGLLWHRALFRRRELNALPRNDLQMCDLCTA